VTTEQDGSDRVFMAQALEEAQAAAEAGEVPVGAVIVRHGQVLARGHNRREQTHDATAHAEVVVLRQAGVLTGGWRLTDCTLYVTLEPCPMCMAALVAARVRTVVYGAVDEALGACGSLLNLADYPGMGYTVEIRGGVQAEQCRQLLSRFFGQRR
jgi:tRNA(adenine34) deaminase